MARILASLVCIIMGISQSTANAQGTPAPQDQPFSISEAEMARVRAAMEPFVQMGRDTFQGAKERFLLGLPERYAFFVTVDLIDSESRSEQVFLFVDSIDPC